MARKEYAGGAPQTTLTSSMTAGAPTSGQTFTVASGTGYPTGAYPGGFVVIIDVGTPSEEKILSSARSGNTFTVATSGRGYDGTTAVSHGGGVTTGTVDHGFDAASADDFGGHVYGTADAHDASAISYAGGTGMSATDVEAAIDELATEKANDADVVHDTGNETIAGVKTFSSDPVIPDEAYDATAWNGSLEPPTKNAVRDKIEDILDGVTFTGDVVVPAETYGAGWNGSNEAPTKNDVYDKIETLVSPTTAIVKSSDEIVNNSVTLQDDNELVAAVIANTDYIFEGWLVTNSVSAAADLKVAFTVPASAVVMWTIHYQDVNDVAHYVLVSSAPVISGSGTSGTVDLRLTAGNIAKFEGSVRVAGTAGNLQLQWAQGTLTASDTTVKAGSWMSVTKAS